jgi:hypothetical protein
LKKKKKTCFEIQQTVFFYRSFLAGPSALHFNLAGPLALHFKDDL